MSTNGAPPPRHDQPGVSTGKHLVVLGGVDAAGTPHSDAYRYDPAADHWEKLSKACIDPDFAAAALAWLDNEVLAWGAPAGTPQTASPYQGWLLPLAP